LQVLPPVGRIISYHDMDLLKDPDSVCSSLVATKVVAAESDCLLCMIGTPDGEKFLNEMSSGGKLEKCLTENELIKVRKFAKNKNYINSNLF
jgi:hypothetical protein